MKDLTTVDAMRFYLSTGAELEFKYNGKSYAITRTEDGHIFYEAHKPETTQQKYSPEEMLQTKIDGKKFEDILDGIEITDQLF